MTLKICHESAIFISFQSLSTNALRSRCSSSVLMAWPLLWSRISVMVVSLSSFTLGCLMVLPLPALSSSSARLVVLSLGVFSSLDIVAMMDKKGRAGARQANKTPRKTRGGQK